jgi:hypothetical protein
MEHDFGHYTIILVLLRKGIFGVLLELTINQNFLFGNIFRYGFSFPNFYFYFKF